MRAEVLGNLPPEIISKVCLRARSLELTLGHALRWTVWVMTRAVEMLAEGCRGGSRARTAVVETLRS